MNTTSFDWLHNKHDLFPAEWYQQAELVRNTVMYKDPVHAIITLEGTTITIEGMESEMVMESGLFLHVYIDNRYKNI